MIQFRFNGMRAASLFLIGIFSYLLACSTKEDPSKESDLYIIERGDMPKVPIDVWPSTHKSDPAILRSRSPVLSIQDGNVLHKDAWTVSPFIRSDVFVTSKFDSLKTVHFFSDIDTISFEVEPNNTFDFVVFLNNGEKAFTQIDTDTSRTTTIQEREVHYYHNKLKREPACDTLHFDLGKDNCIHLTGKINDSENLDLIFDTGANTNIICTALLENKVVMEFDGNITNRGAGGSNHVSVSSINQLEIEELVWDSSSFISINYKDPDFDGVLGWTAFENKIIEINYEDQLLIIKDTLERIPDGYEEMRTRMIMGIPFIEGCVTLDGKESFGWFEFDTGSDGSFSMSQKFADKHELNNAMKITGTSVSKGSSGAEWTSNRYILPELRLGTFSVYQVPISIRSEDPKGVGYLDILGNRLLKNFNAIIDLKKKTIYLKPNDMQYY